MIVMCVPLRCFSGSFGFTQFFVGASGEGKRAGSAEN
jgi:hypothetical protein